MIIRKVLFSLFIILALFSLSAILIPNITTGIAYAYDDQDDSGDYDSDYGGDENYDDQPPGGDSTGYDDGCTSGFGCGDGDGGNPGPTQAEIEAGYEVDSFHGFAVNAAMDALGYSGSIVNALNEMADRSSIESSSFESISSSLGESSTHALEFDLSVSELMGYKDEIAGFTTNQKGISVFNQNETANFNKKAQGPAVNDPVIIASGIEDFRMVDMAYKSLLGTIEIKRRYLSSRNNELSSFGYGWFFNYDTHVVVGRNPLIKERELLTAERKQQAQELVNQAATAIDGVRQSLAAARLDASKIQEENEKIIVLSSQIQALKDQTLNKADEAEAAAANAEAKAPIANMPEADQKAAEARQMATNARQYSDQAIQQANAAFAAVLSSNQTLEDANQIVSAMEAMLAEMEAKKLAMDGTFQYLSEEAEQARWEARAEEERFPLDPYPEDPSVYFGAGYIKLIDDGGIPILFKENDEGVFIPVTDNQSYTDTIVAVDGGYLKTTKHGDTRFFADPGNGTAPLTTITDRNGNTISFIRANGKLETIVDATGRKTQIQYNDLGFISTVVDPEGLYYEYEYENGLLVTYIDPEGSFWSYGYDENRRLVSRIDPLGFTYRYRYDELGRVIEETDKVGHAYTYAYDPGNQQTTVRDRRGLTTVYHYNENHRLVQTDYPDGSSTGITYDERNNPATVTDENGHTTSFIYDSQNNVTSVVNALGEQWQYNYDDKFNQITSEIDPAGRTRHFTYDDSGNLIRIDHPDGTVETRTYDDRGLIASATDANGNTTRFEHDELGYPVAVTNADGTARSASYDRLGRVLSATDENDATTEYTYNNVGKVTSVTDPMGAVTTLVYDARHQTKEVINAKGDAQTYTHTPNGKVKVVKDPLGNCTTYDYDAADNLISETKPNNTGIAYELDQRGRIVSQTTFPGNLQTAFTYDPAGRRTSVTDANGNTIQYEYDALGRVIAETNALGNRVYSVYSPTGKLTGFTDAKGHSRTYAYDDMDRQVQITDALGNTTEFNYDLAGNLIAKTLADGSRVVHQYDTRNRLIETAYPDGTCKAFEYDPAGRMIRMENDLTTETRQYDLAGRLLSTHDSRSDKTITYAYDILGKRSYMQDPDRGESFYEYDPNGNLESFTDPKDRVTDYIYDELNRLTQAIYPNHTTTIWQYDLNNRLLKIENLDNRNKSFATSAYTYDDAGNRMTQTDEQGRITRYGYDAAYQLISVTYLEEQPRKVDYYKTNVVVGQVAYTYDPAGNRLSKKEDGQTIHYEYNPANQMLTAGETTFTYDANGNRIGKHDSQGDTFYEYNYDSLLTKVSTPDKDTTYGYDSLNRRILKSSRWDWETVRYIYDGLDVVQEFTSTRYHQKVTAYYRANGMIVANQRYVTNGASSYFGIHRPNSLGSFYAYDGLGSVAGLSNYRGWAGSSRYEYDAFGSLRKGSLKKNPNSFTGKRYDAESGFYHFHFRQYDPSTGVWTSPDPIDIVGGLNLYGYVLNNPVLLLDPLGLCKESNTLYHPVPINPYSFSGALATFGIGISEYIVKVSWDEGGTPSSPFFFPETVIVGATRLFNAQNHLGEGQVIVEPLRYSKNNLIEIITDPMPE